MMNRNRGVAQPPLAVKGTQHRQECLCYFACEPRWGSETAVVAPRCIGALRPPSTTKSRGPTKQVRATLGARANAAQICDVAAGLSRHFVGPNGVRSHKQVTPTARAASR